MRTRTKMVAGFGFAFGFALEPYSYLLSSLVLCMVHGGEAGSLAGETISFPSFAFVLTLRISASASANAGRSQMGMCVVARWARWSGSPCSAAGQLEIRMVAGIPTPFGLFLLPHLISLPVDAFFLSALNSLQEAGASGGWVRNPRAPLSRAPRLETSGL
ncbi:hypothetical protein B0H12DRAFT_1162670, partial [Mycena haematopus]